MTTACHPTATQHAGHVHGAAGGCCAAEAAPAPASCCASGHPPHAPVSRAPAPAPDAAVAPAAPRLAFWRDISTWLRAARNTAHCLLGCAIGDIAAMTLVPLAWPEVPFAVLMAIAIAAGIATSLALETLVLRWREGLAWRRAFGVAWGMSLISMVGMEVAMNVTDWLAMGGQRMPIDHAGYWLAWLPALAAGFLAPLPYNYLVLKRHGRSCH